MSRNFLLSLLACAALALPTVVTGQQSDAADGEGYKVGDRLLAPGGGAEGEFTKITWDDLIPPDWIPEELFKGLFDDVNLDGMQDTDPRAIEALARIREEWDKAPVVAGMDGRRVRIPGFVVPLDVADGQIDEFLLVPYFGACIHVPPPPANQLIHVMPDQAIPAAWNMAPVWVSGVLTVARFDSEMGNAGYQLRGVRVEEYTEQIPQN